MGCSDARTRHLPVIVTHRKSTHTYNIATHLHPMHTFTLNHPTPYHLLPEYASAVTLPRISSESVKKMALAKRKKAF